MQPEHHLDVEADVRPTKNLTALISRKATVHSSGGGKTMHNMSHADLSLKFFCRYARIPVEQLK